MTLRLLYVSILLLGFQTVYSQQMHLQFHLVDEETGEPISDAHVFIIDSSIGTTSDTDGLCELSVAAQETQTCIISHISYVTIVLSPEQYPSLTDGAEIKMVSNGIDISAIQFSAKRSGKWKKNVKKFKRALLGDGKAAGKCEILNPEVLRFEEKDGQFSATAIDLLKIDNNYLDYNINFWLEELTIEADDSKFYKGNGQFIDKGDPNDKRLQKRRKQTYENSIAHFLRSLLVSSDWSELRDHGYVVSTDLYTNGRFTNLSYPEPSELIKADSVPGFYQLHFSEFLTIKHINIVGNPKSGRQAVSISTAEQQKFGSNASQTIGSGYQVATSRLYKIAPYLLFDIRGNIINKSANREYEYWADQRLATTLPVDYKKFSELIEIKPKEELIDTLSIFKNLVDVDPTKSKPALQFIKNNWSESYIMPLLDILRLSGDDILVSEIQKLLQDKVPDMEPDYYNGIQWLWADDPTYGSYYGDYKAYLHSKIDTHFYKYFANRQQQSLIRLDEIVWGGVIQDGIPPLRSPQMMNADKAQYLSDSDVVFALNIDGQAVAYPQRILAWHEFFTDEIGEQSIAGVYCTLCGTVIIYNTKTNGIKHDLGTSGFLYRSNKLMYDRATQSLWSTILGQPVLGPLVNKGIELQVLPVETTTWGEWRLRHPNTKVLSLDTGHDRDYSEGAAYKDYYADDALMFPVPYENNELAHKARVFIPRTNGFKEFPLAISVDYLKRKRIHHDDIGGRKILVISEDNGSSKAYFIKDQKFKSYKKGKLADTNGNRWKVTSTELLGPNKQKLKRIPGHEVFWFAWINVFPNSRLVKK